MTVYAERKRQKRFSHSPFDPRGEQQMSNCLNCEKYLRIYYCICIIVSMDPELKRTFIIYISVKCALMLLYMMHLQHDSDI
jgi:hypothetical protein